MINNNSVFSRQCHKWLCIRLGLWVLCYFAVWLQYHCEVPIQPGILCTYKWFCHFVTNFTVMPFNSLTIGTRTRKNIQNVNDKIWKYFIKNILLSWTWGQSVTIVLVTINIIRFCDILLLCQHSWRCPWVRYLKYQFCLVSPWIF